MCAAAENRIKITKTPNFGSSKSLKVIDVNATKKLVISAYYDNQHAGAYQHNLFHAKQNNSGKITTFKGTPLFEARVRKISWAYGVGAWNTKIYV